MGNPNAMPGIGNSRTATPRKILATLAGVSYLPGGAIIDGAKSRDFNNTGNLDVLTAGLLLGKVTASGKYAPSILGVLQAAYTDNELEITVSAAQATEIVRRVGTSGNLTIIGPPTAAGVVAEVTAAFSAVNTTTGVITIADLGANFVAGSLICTDDGTAYPVTLISDEYGIKVTDDSQTSIDVALSRFLIAGTIDASQIRSYPADASLKAWLKAKLRANCPGLVFDDDF